MDRTTGRYQENEGRIVALQNNSDEYVCQGCGSSDVAVQVTCLFCNACRSRTVKEYDSIDELFKIIIVADNKDEYSLRIPKNMVIKSRFLREGISTDSGHVVDVTGNVNIVSPVRVHFKYDRTTGIVLEITPVNTR